MRKAVRYVIAAIIGLMLGAVAVGVIAYHFDPDAHYENPLRR